MNPPQSPPPYGFYNHCGCLGDDGDYSTNPPPSTSPEETFRREKLQLMRQLNRANSTQLAADSFTWSLPEPADRHKFVTGNTQVTLNPVYWSNYQGAFTFSYNRLDLCRALKFPSLIALVDFTDQVMLSELIPQINVLFGLDLQIGDYKDVALPVVDPEFPLLPLTVKLEAETNSYAYVGSFDLPLGPSAVQVSDEFVLRRLYVMRNDGNVDSVAENFAQANNPWLYFRNVTNLVLIGPTLLHPAPLGGLTLTGGFHFTKNGTPTVATTVQMDASGSVLTSSMDLAYDGLEESKLTRRLGSATVYAAHDTDFLARYDLSGVRDTDYVPGIAYTPVLIEQDPLGRVLAVSPVFDAPIPTDDNVVGPQYRIDRLLATGALDLTFTPVIITGSGNTQPLPIADMAAAPNGGFYVVFFGTPAGVFSSMGILPVINGATMATQPVESDYGVNPVARFSDLGKWDQTFDVNQKTYSQLWLTMGEYLAQGDQVLNVTARNVSYFTQRFNIATGQPHRQPVSFTRDGKMINLSSNEMADSYRWITTKGIRPFSNGGFAAVGVATLPLQEGGFGAPISMVTKYDSNGVAKKVMYHITPVPPDTPPTIVDVIVSEYDTQAVEPG